MKILDYLETGGSIASKLDGVQIGLLGADRLRGILSAMIKEDFEISKDTPADLTDDAFVQEFARRGLSVINERNIHYSDDQLEVLPDNVRLEYDELVNNVAQANSNFKHFESELQMKIEHASKVSTIVDEAFSGISAKGLIDNIDSLQSKISLMLSEFDMADTDSEKTRLEEKEAEEINDLFGGAIEGVTVKEVSDELLEDAKEVARAKEEILPDNFIVAKEEILPDNFIVAEEVQSETGSASAKEESLEYTELGKKVAGIQDNLSSGALSRVEHLSGNHYTPKEVRVLTEALGSLEEIPKISTDEMMKKLDIHENKKFSSKEETLPLGRGDEEFWDADHILSEAGLGGNSPEINHEEEKNDKDLLNGNDNIVSP